MLDNSSKEDILVYYAPFWQHDEGKLLPKRRITRGEKQIEKKDRKRVRLDSEERSAEVHVLLVCVVTTLNGANRS